MFCGKCGANNSDDARFCKACGAPISTVSANSGGPTVSAPPIQTDRRNRIVGIAAVAVIAVVVIILLIALFGGRSYKSTVNKFLDATFDADAKTMLSLIPDDLVDEMLDELGYDRSNMKDAIKEMNEELQDEMDDVTSYLGDDWKISYKILSAENASAKELRELKTDYEEYDVKVSAAKNVEVEVTLKTDDLETSNTLEIPVIKVGRSWYLDIENLDSIF